ncbi:uncharacterized protein [Drosophila bipectinata]|uniref:uncharacterized protein n=1 Tax=Drosophila bipectinata TaxID=42026 RepID=UPI0038B411E5
MGRSSLFAETMTQCVGAVVILLILSHVLAADEEMASAYESTCVIRATLYATSPLERSSQDFGLPLDIDCNGNRTLKSDRFDLGAQRVAGKRHVQVDGTGTPPLDIDSYGLEYLDNCLQLESLEIQRFVGDSTIKLSCDGAILSKLTAVSFENNELGTLSGDTFQKVPHLKVLKVQQNSLKYMEVLENATELEELLIKDETKLVLADKLVLQKLSMLKKVHLGNLKQIRNVFFEKIPENLTELVVRNTPIQPGELHLENGIQELVNITITDCRLSSFGLDPGGLLKVKKLNLSGNALKSLSYEYHNIPLYSSDLEVLDLSRNQLEYLNRTWFYKMIALQRVYLQENRFHSMSLGDLVSIAPARIQLIDLRSNDLISLKDVARANDAIVSPPRLWVDGNHWSCQWLLNFSHTEPMLFRLFQYTKYISHINVNGLSCEPLDPPTEAPPKVGRIMQVRINGTSEAYLPVPHPDTNVSSFTVLYGNPVELHRSQRNGALIIVFMLPLGIALLFLLLYLYLHCERLFHLSYYVSGLPCFGDEKSSSGPRFVDHVDIVRYPVANGSASPADVDIDVPDGYETPVSGAASICNCTGHRESACSRTHHVTYESLPTELPYQLYAEIKEQVEEEKCGESDGMLSSTPGPTAPVYDHLSFVEAAPKEDELRDIS